MQFLGKLELLERFNIAEGEAKNSKRFYDYQGKKLPSITTVLNTTKDKTFLENWKKNVGEENAKRITQTALRNGTEFHSALEKFFLKNEWNKTEWSFATRQMFTFLVPRIKDKIQVIYGIEYPLVSEELGVAGKCDMICQYDDKLVILDWKTTRSERKQEWIEDYILQCVFYAHCVNRLNLFSRKIENIVIAFGIIGSYQIFELPITKEWEDKLKNRIQKYKEENQEDVRNNQND